MKELKRNALHTRIASKHGMKRDVVMGTFDHTFVIEEEKRLIRELKTHKRHSGANFTDGGEGSLGWNPSQRTRKRMREARANFRPSVLHRIHLSEAHHRRYERSEERQKAILTESDISLIRDAWDAYDASKRGATKAFCVTYAVRYNLTSENIYSIIKRKFWKHLP